MHPDLEVFCGAFAPLAVGDGGDGADAGAYARLHGRNAEHWFRAESGRNDRYNYLYKGAELDEWVEKVRNMKKQVNDLFMITNNHYRGQAVVNALEMQSALGILPQNPAPWLVDYYEQLKACRTGAE